MLKQNSSCLKVILNAFYIFFFFKFVLTFSENGIIFHINYIYTLRQNIIEKFVHNRMEFSVNIVQLQFC